MTIPAGFLSIFSGVCCPCWVTGITLPVDGAVLIANTELHKALRGD